MGRKCLDHKQLRNKSFNLVMLNASVDLRTANHFSKVSYFADSTNYITIDPDMQKVNDIFLSVSELDDESRFEDLSSSKVLNSLMVTNEDTERVIEIVNQHRVDFHIDEEKPIEDRTYLRIYIRADEFMKTYQLEPYGFLNFLGDVGGIFSILSTMVFCLVSGIVTLQLQSKLISETYQV